MTFDDDTSLIESDEAPRSRATRRVSGTAVVIAMFVFGITATAALWTYWALHTGPFRPLQDALAKEFPGSVPRVDGGQRKLRKGMPTILRAVLRVNFDPVTETAKGEQILARVEQLSRQYVDLGQYDVIDVYLYQGVPEQEIREREFERKLKPPSPRP
jgi:hypothetical protein